MKKRVFSSVLAALLIIAVFALPIVNSRMIAGHKDNTSENVSKAPSGLVKPEKKPAEKNQETIVASDKKVNVIVELNGAALLDTVLSSEGVYQNVPQLVLTDEGKVCMDTIKKNQAVVKASIQKLLPDSDFSDSRTYSAVLNGFSVKTNISSIPKMQKISGVSRVTVADTVLYTEDDENIPATVGTLSQTQNDLLNVSTAYENGFDGSGMLIAVLDSEFDTQHEVFSAVPTTGKYDKQQIQNLYQTTGFGTDKKYGTDDLYRNEKIVYAYDYAQNDNDTYDNSHCHGTAVAALAAGDNGQEDDNAFRGIAFHAQLALMKVSENGRSVLSEYVLAALDDCAKLGADVVNISLGTDRQTEMASFLKEAMDKISQTGTMIVCPAGNTGINTVKETLSSSEIDYGALNVLACMENTMAAASSVNSHLSADCLTVDGNRFLYSDAAAEEDNILFAETITEPTAYLYLAENEDGSFDYDRAKEQIAVIFLGEHDIQEQVAKAFLADVRALALIDSGAFEKNAYNNTVVLSHKHIPVIFLDDNDSDYFEIYSEGMIETGENAVLVDSVSGGQMADSSSWGVTPDLRLKPEMTAVGQNVYTAAPDGKYQYFSGTSASTALVSGAYALVKAYLQGFEWFGVMPPAEQSRTVSAVLMSNSEPVKQYSGEELVYLSPRKQGAGRVDIASALQSGAYLEVPEKDKPKAELGDGTTGEYAFTFRVINLLDEEQTFAFQSYIQTDESAIMDDQIINTLKPYSLKEYSSVTFAYDGEPTDEITVEPGGEAEIHAVIQLDSSEDLPVIENFPNGFYIDGYVVLENTEGRTLNLPFVGFYGDWSGISPFENAENNFCAADYNSTVLPVLLGQNPFTGKTEAITISKNTVGNYYDLSQLKNAYILPDFYLLRDVYELTVSVSDKDGKQLFSHNYGTVSACREVLMYTKLLSQNVELAQLFSNLSDGDYRYAVSAKTMGIDGTLSEQVYTVQTKFSVDSQKPDDVLSRTYQQDEKVYLELSARDNRTIQGFAIYTAAYNTKNKKYEYADRLEELIQNGYVSEQACMLKETRTNADGSVTFVYDITELYGELVKLKLMTRESIAPCSSEKIAYKAIDGAWNTSSVKIADAVVYQQAEITLKDQNSRPVRNVTMQLGTQTAVSDKNGKVIFGGLLPDIYLLQIKEMPEGCTAKEQRFLVKIEKYGDGFRQEIQVQFAGEYSEESDEEEQQESLSAERIPPTAEHDWDKDPFLSLTMIGVLLLVSSLSLAVSRHRRK